MARSAFLHPFAKPAADQFVTIVRGEGAMVYDDTGKGYVDGLASLWYSHVGHGRVEIAEAVGAQLAELDAFHTFDIFTNPRAEEVCELIAGLSPISEARVFLTNSGSEAVDTVLKLSRLNFSLRGEPERSIVLARHDAYHGVTYGGMSAQGLPLNKQGFGPLLADVCHTAPHDLDEATSFMAEHGDRVAAVIAEPVLGAGGVFPPAPGYLEGLRALCDEHGALLIFDEVITGFGRLGSWFGAIHYGVTPDLITFAKGVTSGYQPLGGVIVGSEVLDALEADPDFILRHGFTYSGHPAACVAGSVNIGIIRDDDLLGDAGRIARRLGGGLASLADEGLVSAVRGEGGIWAVSMNADVNALDVRMGLLDRGVIARPIGTAHLAFCPPLVITDAQIDHCLEALDASLRAVG
jgi:putrescine---pyruvate transaminase